MRCKENTCYCGAYKAKQVSKCYKCVKKELYGDDEV